MTLRLTTAAMFMVAAALAYPFETVVERWVLGVALVVVIALFAWWRGEFVTTRFGHRWAIWRGNRGASAERQSVESATVVLRIDGAQSAGLPVAVLAGYADRYGLKLDKVRITSCDLGGQRQSWISLTLDATRNLPALQARSPRIPLHDTVNIVARRLADQLREDGWVITPVTDVVGPVRPEARETWRALNDDAGFLAVYRVPAPALEEALDAVATHPSEETWTAVEFGAGTVAAVTAVRSADSPAVRPPIPGLAALGGRQRRVLTALNPLSQQRIIGHQVADPELAGRLHWPTGSSPVRT